MIRTRPANSIRDGGCGLNQSPDLWLQSSPSYRHRLSAWQNRGDHLCCVRFPCVHAVATTPAQQLAVLHSLVPSSRISLPRKGDRVGLRIGLFEVCSAFTRVTACTLARSPCVTRYVEGFSHFVTSMTAPTTSGWSIRRVGFSPTGKRRLITAHTLSGQSPPARADIRVCETPPANRSRSYACTQPPLVEQRHRGFAKEIGVKRQRVVIALKQEQQAQQRKH